MSNRNENMSGKICLVTGATSGIGAATALALAARGATVVGVGRDQKRCETAAESIARRAGNDRVAFLCADLSAQRQVRGLAAEFQRRYPRLDVLVNNVGARFDRRLTSPEGYEMTLTLNHLSHFLLTLLLFEGLSEAGRSRVVNVSSAAHRSCPGIDFDDLQSEKEYCGRKAYARSKLANLLFGYELNRRLKGTGVTVNAAAPGNVLSRFASNNGWTGWGRHVLGSLRSGSLLTPAEGAKTVVFLACAREVEGITGGYFARSAPARPSPAAQDAAAARRLWEASLEMTRIEKGERREEP